MTALEASCVVWPSPDGSTRFVHQRATGSTFRFRVPSPVPASSWAPGALAAELGGPEVAHRVLAPLGLLEHEGGWEHPVGRWPAVDGPGPPAVAIRAPEPWAAAIRAGLQALGISTTHPYTPGVGVVSFGPCDGPTPPWSLEIRQLPDQLVVGPRVGSGWLDAEALPTRLAAAATHPEAQAAFDQATARFPDQMLAQLLPPRHALRELGHAIAAHVVRTILGPDLCWILPMDGSESRLARVRPLPGPGPAVEVSLDELVDPSVGLISTVTTLAREPGEPHALFGTAARVAQLGRVLPWRPDAVASGMAFELEASRVGAIGEAIERYCGNYPGPYELESSEATLPDGPFLSDTNDPLFLETQLERPDFPYATVGPDTPRHWVRVPALDGGSALWAPATRVHLNRSEPSGVPRPMMYSGIAAGSSLEHACLSGIRELIERDATMLWWHARIAARPVVPERTAAEPLLRGVAPHLRLAWLHLRSDLPEQVAACLLVDPEQGCLSVGFACRGTLWEAMFKATAEAFQLRRVAVAMADPGSWFWRAIERGIIGRGSLAEPRADRAYRLSFRPDWSDMTSLMASSQYYLDRSTWAPVLARFDGEPDVVAPEPGTTRGLPAIVEALHDLGYAAYAVDLTTRDVAGAASVARVLVPGLCGNAAPATPFLGNRRLQQAAGWKPGMPLTPFDLSPLPHS